MRRMTSCASFGFHRSMLISKRTLLVRMALNARGVRAGGQSRLLEFKTAVRIVTIAATHHAFQHFVMEW